MQNIHISVGTVSAIDFYSNRTGFLSIATSTANPVTVLLRYADSVRVTYTDAPIIVVI